MRRNDARRGPALVTGRPRLFPVGLYATLLGALCCLVAPPLPRRVQGWLQAVMCGPVHVVADWIQGPPEPVAVAGADVLIERLRQRQEDAALRALGWLPPGLEPVVCRVVAREGRGGAGWPSRLVLDRTAREVAGCAGFVTHGDVLLGFLAAPDDGPSAEEPLADRARVALLHDFEGAGDLPRRVAAGLELGDELLRFVVEPAPRVERFPLRCRMLDDPYAASRLEHSGAVVRTLDLPGDPLGTVPAGLDVGRLRVWGYRSGAGAPIELFVEPERPPETWSVVVLWRHQGGGSARLRSPLADTARQPVRIVRAPAPPPAEERWLLRASRDGRLVQDAAVLLDGWLVGRTQQASGSHGLAAPLGRTDRRWSAILLPTDPSVPPLGLSVRAVAEVVRGRVREVELAVSDVRGRLPNGILFSGANGAAFPAGLPVGDVWPTAGGTRLRVVLPPVLSDVLDVVRGPS